MNRLLFSVAALTALNSAQMRDSEEDYFEEDESEAFELKNIDDEGF